MMETTSLHPAFWYAIEKSEHSFPLLIAADAACELGDDNLSDCLRWCAVFKKRPYQWQYSGWSRTFSWLTIPIMLHHFINSIRYKTMQQAYLDLAKAYKKAIVKRWNPYE